MACKYALSSALQTMSWAEGKRPALWKLHNVIGLKRSCDVLSIGNMPNEGMQEIRVFLPFLV